jgi:transposase-like protein
LKPECGRRYPSASRYIRENHKPEDRLAVVVINKRSGAVVQRIARAESVAAEDFQRWLRCINDSGYEVYLSASVIK